jgi:TniQ
MARAGQPFRFAFSPPPADGELLSSWLHRMAIGHAASGLEFAHLAGGDIDWRPPSELLAQLAGGSDLPVSRLRAMTLSTEYRRANREHFALSQRPFPGCHAFCPVCALDDIEAYGAVIQRAENAWVWSAACVTHGCMLDGVGGPADVTPRCSRTATWEDGVIAPVSHVTPAPAFLIELQSAAQAASRGVAPDERWLIHDPALFLRAISRVVDLIMLKAPHDPHSSGLGQLVGHVWPQTRTMGETSWSADWIGRLPTPERVQALAGVASLLADPSAGLSAPLTAWFGGNPNPRPWGRVGGEWGPGQLIAARNFIAAWPNPLRREAVEGLGHCITALQRRGYQIPT